VQGHRIEESLKLFGPAAALDGFDYEMSETLDHVGRNDRQIRAGGFGCGWKEGQGWLVRHGS